MEVKGNEKGAALVLAIVILFVLSGTLFHFISLYENEKNFWLMEREWNTVDNLLMTSAFLIVLQLEEEKDLHLTAGKLEFFSGNVHYQITMVNSTEKRILLRGNTETGTYRGARFSYCTVTGRIWNWVEGGHIQ